MGSMPAASPPPPTTIASMGHPSARRGSTPTALSRFGRLVQKNGALLLMASPALLLLLVFSYVPMVGLVMAFQDYKAYQGILGSAWVGLQNFQFLFGTQDAWHITFNTIFTNTLFIATTLAASLTIALLLNEIRESGPFLAKFYQSTLFFPYFLSYIIISYFVFAMLNADTGLLDKLLASLKLPQVDWYTSPQFWPAILTLVNLWKGAGFWSIVYLAGIIAINPEYYEAARVDGANKWQQIRGITLPLIAPLIVINVLLAIGHIFYADFGLFFQVTNNNPMLYPTTDVIDTYVYRSLTSLGDVGMAAAAGLYQAVVGFILVLGSNWLVRRVAPEKLCEKCPGRVN